MDIVPQASVSDWASLRKAVAAALFITYFLYYAVYYFASFKQNERPKLFVQIESLGAKIYLFGVGCLLSLNYMQASVHQAVFAYFTMLAIILMMLTMVFEILNEKLVQISVIAFYSMLFIWYMGIVIDYYTLLST